MSVVMVMIIVMIVAVHVCCIVKHKLFLSAMFMIMVMRVIVCFRAVFMFMLIGLPGIRTARGSY